MKKSKTGQLCYLLLLFACLLSGCGNAEQAGTDSSYYRAEDTAAFQGLDNIRYRDGYLYYADSGNIYKKHIGKSGEMPEEEPEEIVYHGAEGMLLRDFAVDDSGIYCFLVRTRLTETLQTEITDGVLVKVRIDGSEAYELPVEDVDRNLTGVSRKHCLAVGGEGRLFLLSGRTIYVAEGEDGFRHTLDVSAGGSGGQAQNGYLCEGAGGRVYCCIDRPGGRAIYEVAKEKDIYALKKMSGSGRETADVEAGQLFGSSWGLLCSGQDGILRQYSEEDSCWAEVLNWSASNVGGSISDVVQLSEARFLACYFDSAERKTRACLLDKVPVDAVPERKELVLACYEDASPYLEEQVAAFNRTNSRYRIIIQVYQGEEGLTRLDADLVSSTPPDLLDLQWLDAEKYAERRVMEDLTPYLESSPALDKADYLGGIIDTYTQNGCLICIPTTFSLMTVLGRVSLFGEKAGWDMEKAMALTDRYPEYSLFDRYGFALNLNYCYGDYILDRFVDWDNRTCSFESQEFCSLIEWIADHSTGTGYENGYQWEDFTGQMAVRVNLLSATDLVRYLGLFNERAVIIGYPSADGRALHRVQVFDAVGIISGSKHKEGAWEFLAYFLSDTAGSEAYGFPTNRNALEQLLDETVIYPDASEPRPLSQEEKRQLWEAVSAADFNTAIGSARRDMVLQIIGEELEGYLSGYKPLEEASAVIWNRVDLLLQE